MKALINDSIALEYELKASPERVFRALSSEIGSWWTHSFKKGSTITMEVRVGGAFRESWPGGGALYATVTYLDPPRELILSGPMGMSGAVASTMRFSLEATEAGTKLSLLHDILGYLEPGTVEAYREGWKELLGSALPKFIGPK